ncbi:MAG: TRAP transporter small permease subunit, partial [Oricola sp.]
EMAQFTLTAYYLLGGPYSIQLGSNVRMDLLYGGWTDRQKAWVDAFSVFCLMFFLGVLLHGGISSTTYAFQYGERSYSAWRPYMAPIKVVMCIGIILMLLQAIAEFFKDIARIRGEEI